jgi:hypothetical protein
LFAIYVLIVFVIFSKYLKYVTNLTVKKICDDHFEHVMYFIKIKTFVTQLGMYFEVVIKIYLTLFYRGRLHQRELNLITY